MSLNSHVCLQTYETEYQSVANDVAKKCIYPPQRPEKYGMISQTYPANDIPYYETIIKGWKDDGAHYNYYHRNCTQGRQENCERYQQVSFS